MSDSWDLLVSTSDITTTRLRERERPEPADGEVLLATSRVGLTANNVTYAVLGDTLRYWRFFPVSEDGWGRVPLWGFADVVTSRAAGVAVGERVYGYLPTSGHLVVRPDRTGPGGFRDAAEHRGELPAVYNAYTRTSTDPSYTADGEDLTVLFRPLFTTAFVLADQLAGTEGEGAGGATTVVLSSASSKTAYSTAALLQGGPVRVVGLTSAGNAEFVRTLGCYDDVLTYDEVSQLPAEPTAYVDAAGDQRLRERLHDHLREHLVLDLVLGVTHQDTGRAEVAHGARPSQFFAPDVIAERTGRWGRDGFAQRLGEAWSGFLPRAQQWVDVTPGAGPDELVTAWDEVVAGRVAPRTGHVLTF